MLLKTVSLSRCVTCCTTILSCHRDERRVPSSRVNLESKPNRFYKVSWQLKPFMSRGSFLLPHLTNPRLSSLLQEHAGYKVRERRLKRSLYQKVNSNKLHLRPLRPTVVTIRRPTLTDLVLQPLTPSIQRSNWPLQGSYEQPSSHASLRISRTSQFLSTQSFKDAMSPSLY